ncbi:MAG: DUF3179 domain-containing protein [Planctomycetota bacterium]
MQKSEYIKASNSIVAALICSVLFGGNLTTAAYIRGPAPQYPQNALPGWRTNTAKKIIELNELQSSGGGKDDIPAIDRPHFVNIRNAKTWLKPNEPIISIVVKRIAKAYPLQILIWHEIVNDNIRGTPIAVTFSPLCYSAIVFNRRVTARESTFGVSGMLRNSGMVMYDRQTQTLWQQFTGQAIVGDKVPKILTQIPSQIISFAQFTEAYPNGTVLSRRTGYRRRYGQNPYTGYDDIDNKPFMYQGKTDPRLKPMEKLVGVTIAGQSKAYPYAITSQKRVINDEIAGRAVVVFHDTGTVSALDEPIIAQSRQVGSTGVFSRSIYPGFLSFTYDGTKFIDTKTKSTWLINGRAIAGPLKGKRLTPLLHGDYFAFAYLAFKPNTKIYE